MVHFSVSITIFIVFFQKLQTQDTRSGVYSAHDGCLLGPQPCSHAYPFLQPQDWRELKGGVNLIVRIKLAPIPFSFLSH